MKIKLMMTAIASVAALSATSANAQDICSNEYIADVVYYATGQSQSQKLNELADRIQNVVNSCDVESIQIDSHTDASGGDAANQALSQRRADALRSKLIAKGIDGNLIIATGYGEQQADFTTADQARRSDVRIKTRQVVTYSEPVTQTYTAPTQAYETVVETVAAPAPTPIEPTTVVTQAPYKAPTAISTPAPAGTTAYVPAASPPPLPTVGGAGGGALGGISTPVLIGGLAAVVAAGVLIADDDDEPNSP